MEPESTIDEIIKSRQRLRILSIGRSGVGQSSLISCVFHITSSHVSHLKPGELDIEQEFISGGTPFFVLHKYTGFEPGEITNFEIVREFIEQGSKQGLPLKDRIHCLWLCTKTPTASGRVFEIGDEKLLEFAYKIQIPVVIVFTQYDRLVRIKTAELKEEHPNMDPATLDERSKDEARNVFEICVQSLQHTMNHLNIPMPDYVKVSVRPGYKEDVSALVEVTGDIFKERLNGDAWIMWAIVQQAILPLKMDTCITKGMSYYRQVLTGTVPGLGQMLLRSCLMEVHNDIIKCWKFKCKVLNTAEFKRLMLRLIQDVHMKPDVSIHPNTEIISRSVTLVTATSTPLAPPAAILGLTYDFLQWFSNAVLENTPEVQCLLITYTVDLINILRELFDFTHKSSPALTITWEGLREVFEAYECSPTCQRIHDIARCEALQSIQILTADGLDKRVRALVEGYSENRDSS
ncbi:hypothetical protein D9756_011263 [Leucocoprinus leucothites]|uniref:G domain-containing protein n=1 Tax=Leucocoprinus leucothites TaxID=201217 RepID=A0A8H5FRC0_9AGAR|nr:hypothetical protein D9756_011263 [Leucoagaricus leucothites]